MKLSLQAQKIFEAAFADAKTRKHEFLTPEHILLSILKNSHRIKDILTICGADTSLIREQTDEYLQKNMPALQEGDPVQTIGFQNVFHRAFSHCLSAEKIEISEEDLLISLLDESKNYCSYYLRKAGIERLTLLEIIAHGTSSFKDIPEIEIELTSDFSSENQNEPTRPARKSVLEKFTIDLCQEERKNNLDAVIGRDAELERTIQILCRKTKNNPLHVGDAGVGKTAITEGLAQRLVAGKVPDFLKDFTILSLDMTALVAGTKFRGDFEERLKRLADEILKKEKIILFIDEIHSIAKLSSSSGGSLDASNFLKPLLASGKMRCIGSTTFEEYSKYFENDHALARRFQKIDILEPSLSETITILHGLRARYEEYHGITYTDEALQAAAELSAKHITDRPLPDKAIDVIDEAGAFTKIAGKKTVDTACIEMLIAKIARVPERTVQADEKEKLKGLAQQLSSSIFGQEEAVQAVVKAVKRSRAGFRQNNKTVANFLFVGPTGVGKTELAKQLATQLGISLLRFDMSEYQEKHTVSRLIGSPPGYVGFEEGGLLTDAVRKEPHAVILLDEIEKAHSDVFNILLQIMDYASLTDNKGRKADFRNIILILTSNAGAQHIGKPLIGFGERKETEAAINEAVEKTFTPEFRNRLDAIVPFSHLSHTVVHHIVQKILAQLNTQLHEKNVTLAIDDECIAFLAQEGYSFEFGARHIERLIEEKIIAPLVDEVLFGALSSGGSVQCSCTDDKTFPYKRLCFTYAYTNYISQS